MEIFLTPSTIGKNVRLKRILGNGDGRALIFAFDHGVEHGPKDFPPEHIDARTIIGKVVEAGVDAIMTTKGIALYTWNIWAGRTPLILKVTGKTSLRPKEAQFLQSPIAMVEDAVAFGADGVAATIYWGSLLEDLMIKRFVHVVRKCQIYGLPVLMLAYPRGPTIKDRTDPEIVRYASRAGAELGADMIKTHYTGSKETFQEVIKATPVPVLMSGGAKAERPEDFLKIVKIVMEAGAAGVVVGRNIFQSKNPQGMVKAIMKIVHENADVENVVHLIK